MGSFPQSVLVLGGGGQLGTAIVRAFVESGVTVGAVHRRPSPLGLRGVCATSLQGDLFHLPLEALSAAYDLVVDAAAPYPVDLFPAGGVRAALEAADRHVDRLLLLTRRTGRPLLHVGSIAARSKTRRWPPHPYFEVKRRMSDALAAAARAGAPVTVVEPTACLGPWDARPRRLAFLARLAAGELPVLSDASLNVIDVRDFAQVVVELALRRHRSANPIPILGHEVAYPDLAARVAALEGRAPPRVVLTTRAAIWAAFGLEATLAASGRETPAPTLPLLLADAPRPVVEPPTHEALGVSLRFLDATLSDGLAWYRALGYLDRPLGAETSGGDRE